MIYKYDERFNVNIPENEVEGFNEKLDEITVLARLLGYEVDYVAEDNFFDANVSFAGESGWTEFTINFKESIYEQKSFDNKKKIKNIQYLTLNRFPSGKLMDSIIGGYSFKSEEEYFKLAFEQLKEEL